LGLGRIGRAVAARARSLDMIVIATEPNPDRTFTAKHAVEMVDFDTLLTRSDYLSIHCPLTSQTRGMVNKACFDRMKPGSVLINTARGQLVVESDLIQALKSGHLRGAGLDVLEEEPPRPDNPLLQMNNVVLSPHTGGEDTRSFLTMGMEAAECIVKLYRGEWPEGAVVNTLSKENWKWER
jgi:phosphoglycerate dehydrogenase-like enzyme